MENLEVLNTAESIVYALRFLENTAAERGGPLGLPAETEIAILKLTRQAAERIAGSTYETIAQRPGSP